MTPDEPRVSYPADARGDSAPVSARSTSTESIPIVSGDIGARTGENRRTRRARLGTGPVPEQRDTVIPPITPAPLAPSHPEPARDRETWESVVQSAAAQAAPAWEPPATPTTPAWEHDAAPAYAPEPAPMPQPAPAYAPEPAPLRPEEPVTLDGLLDEAASAAAAPAPATAPPRKPPKPGRQPRTAKEPKAPKPEKAPRGAKPQRSAKAAKANANQLQIGGVPKVDLLPPELKAAREWRLARNTSLLLVLIAAIVALAGAGAATGWAQAHAIARDVAQARTNDLLAMQSEFAEVNQVQSDIRAAEQALEEASATDIAWIQFLGELGATIPPQSRLTELTIEMPSPGTPLAAPTDALQGERVATVRFSALSAGVPDVAEWSRAIERMEGVVFVSPRATTKAEEGGGYTVEMTFDISAERLRNAPDEHAEQPEAEEETS